MIELSVKQRSTLVDLIEQVVENKPVDESLLKDIQVVYRFLYLSKDIPAMVNSFLSLIPVTRWSQLTEADVLSEEVILELHLMIGLTEHDLSQWLRGLSFGGVQFFVSIAKEKEVIQLDHMVLKSRYDASIINGVLIDELPKYFDSLTKLLDYALNDRITYKQYRNILVQLPLTQDDIRLAADKLIESHHVLGKIQRSSQLLPFRVFCALFDFLDKKDPYISGVFQVMDQLLKSSTVEKTMQLLNTMPYPIIQLLIERYIRQSDRNVLDHLDQMLPNFEYGSIRKIVRRHQLGVNYKNE